MSTRKPRDFNAPNKGDDLPNALTASIQSEEVSAGGSAPFLEQRRHLIEETAYHMAAERGFEPGHELEDWLEAERQVDTESRSTPVH
jgi:hypothetical protein